jgi:hypothetical protein
MAKIPKDKLDDFNSKYDLLWACLSIETATLESKVIDTETCNRFIEYAEKRFEELGMSNNK